MSEDVARSLGRVEGKLDSLIETIKTREVRTDGLEKRIGKVEAKQHWYSGAAATIGAVFGLYIGKH